MVKVQEILAQNLKKNRRMLGITQGELAERAGLSIHYLAMIEIARKFPTAGVIDRLAAALGISSNELFAIAVPPQMTMEEMQKKQEAILENLNQGIEKALNKLDKALETRCECGPKGKGKSGE